MGRLHSILLFFFIVLSAFYQYSSANGIEANQTVALFINASEASTKKIPGTLFGIFFEEINHAGAGGLWAELVNNRGFEAGGPNTPSNIDPWSVIGNESSVIVSTERSSCFERNKIALRMDVICDTNTCPAGGVGIYNPGFWGMNIEQGKTYKLVLYARSLGPIAVSASLTGSTGLTLATTNIKASDVSNWTKFEVTLQAKGTDGHGFRQDLFEMLKNLKPGFLRFPGGCFVEGEWLRNAFRWKETIGPWEERPGHFGDLAEDLGAAPIWVFNNGVSHNDQVDTSSIAPFLQEILDGLEFAKGDSKSKWGSVRAALGHPEPFDLKYVAVGNYLKFYAAIKRAYPDIKIISNCDGSSQPLDHPADYYDYHIYSNANNVFASAQKFDKAPRSGPKAFVSEYAVTGNDAGKGSLLAALAEAGFLIGIEKNCDAVEMASYAPLFVHTNDRTWNPDAIVFDSSQMYGTPSYWMQHFFRESNGATLLNSTLQSNPSTSLIASAITWKDTDNNKEHLRIKVVNFGSNSVTLQLSIAGLEVNSLLSSGSSKSVLTSSNVMDENSFQVPNKIVPVKTQVEDVGEEMDLVLSPHSLTSIDLLINSNSIRLVGSDSVDKSSY
ncbi:alpha-l-arabinofuranosidase 1 [Phtheirospermum japonicum]|uniref:non-reducing end alpha-L-arabinofuranosidase n=1 Tax=Phtheirospermum japonicum TaxID=374723 RepID=A0A830CU37_9LAMI|nr:alpha-l-arabinofuranosidase 1 [Phtheirospermum japonicum]